MYVIIPVLAVAITLLVIQLLSRNTLQRIAYRCEVNMSLVEPDEVATLTYRVYNTSSWPIMFVSFSFQFDDAVEVRESDEWKARHGSHSFLADTYGREVFLLPHSGVKGTIAFSLKHRGSCRLGRIYLETGDYLGLQNEVISRDVDLRVVCTARLSDREPDIRALGGLLGEITARRFICDDPSLVLGYRGYTGREPLKDISWKQTAKLGELMVKNHDFTVDVDTAILVDMELTDKQNAERCLSLVRTATEYLEGLKIPYSLHSNGDLFETEKGVGRKHLFEIQRRIGESHFTQYFSFDTLVRRVTGTMSGSRGYIVILPCRNPQTEACIAYLNARADVEVCVLISEEEE